MIVSVMQPYFVPYLGYFQLIHASDVFVSYDDVQYVRRGWMNRNRILSGGEAAWFTLPVAHAERTLSIREHHYVDDGGAARQALVRRLANEYRRAPHFRAAMAVLEPLLLHPETNVAAYNLHALQGVCAHVGIDTRFEVASRLPATPGLRGGAALAAISRRLGARTYLNAIGGTALYTAAPFAEVGLELRFLRSEAAPYPQLGDDFVPSLSIIDVLMFNDPPRIAAMLDQYRLVES